MAIRVVDNDDEEVPSDDDGAVARPPETDEVDADDFGFNEIETISATGTASRF
jgi:hypothetical protein